MKLHIHVKFRAFGFTFGTVDQLIIPPFDIPPIFKGRVLFNDRGVLLEIV